MECTACILVCTKCTHTHTHIQEMHKIKVCKRHRLSVLVCVCVNRCIENRAPTHFNESQCTFSAMDAWHTIYMYINRRDSWKYDTRHWSHTALNTHFLLSFLYMCLLISLYGPPLLPPNLSLSLAFFSCASIAFIRVNAYIKTIKNECFYFLPCTECESRSRASIGLLLHFSNALPENYSFKFHFQRTFFAFGWSFSIFSVEMKRFCSELNRETWISREAAKEMKWLRRTTAAKTQTNKPFVATASKPTLLNF